MKSVLASLVKLNGPSETFPYALVGRPLPNFIPSECTVTGEIHVLLTVAEDAKVEAEYDWHHQMMGWKLRGGDN